MHPIENGQAAPTGAIPLHQVAVHLYPSDNVAIAKAPLQPGTVLILEVAPPSALHIRVKQPVPPGHKIALEAIGQGQPVFRYGHLIGLALKDIQPGEHVHTHNLGIGAASREYAQAKGCPPVALLPEDQRRTFLGYRRADGRVATRNHIAVISTVNCSAHACLQIARHFTPDRLALYPNVDGVIALTFRGGCTMRPDGETYITLQRALAGMARHPNVGAALLVGLGCETNQASALIQNYSLGEPSTEPISVLGIQESGGTGPAVEAGIAIVRDLLPRVDDVERTPQSISGLTLALQCGGSDGWSGVTANPVVGLVADELVRQGGTAVLAETPEIYGAEHLLTARSANPEVARELAEQVRWWEAYAQRIGTEIDNNPSYGNKAGGLTTIYEKALGAIAKSGTTPLNAVVGYAEPVTESGLVFMNTPGFDPVSVTGQVAGGCNLVLFTTGCGSAFGFKPAPSIKISSNTALARRMPGDVDFDAGRVLSGERMERLAGELLDLVISVASGQPSKSEAQGIGEAEFSPWHLGELL
jgi:altronate dehydratase